MLDTNGYYKMAHPSELGLLSLGEEVRPAWPVEQLTGVRLPRAAAVLSGRATCVSAFHAPRHRLAEIDLL